MEGLLSYASVCRLLDVSEDTVRRLWKRGLLAAPQKYEGVGIRFREGDVLLYLARARQGDSARSRSPQGDANPPPAKEK